MSKIIWKGIMKCEDNKKTVDFSTALFLSLIPMDFKFSTRF